MFDSACDCHVHIYEPGYPLAATATFVPPHAPTAAYRDVQHGLGLTRVVIVQPTGYGFDNRCTLAAVEQLGHDARAVVVVPPDVGESELDRLHSAGARGVRFMMLGGGVLPWSGLETIAERIEARGWHIDLQYNGHDTPLHESRLLQLPGKLVIDHIGKFLGTARVDSDAFASLCRVLDGGRCWIKLAAPYETSRDGPPAYADVTPLARALAERYPQRCVWASNWPHPNIEPHPSNTSLLEWAWTCMGNEATRRKILVDNPAELYGFGATGAT